MINIVIIEDNTMYLRQMEFFINKNLNSEHQIQSFPLGDWAKDNLKFNPDVFIVDNFLQTKFSEAENGLSLIDDFKGKYPNAMFILHTSFMMGEHELSSKFIYIRKNESSMNQIVEVIKGQLN